MGVYRVCLLLRGSTLQVIQVQRVSLHRDDRVYVGRGGEPKRSTHGSRV